MTIRAAPFTPQVMLTAPRTSSGIPNHDGTLIMYSESTHSFKSHETSSQIRVLDVNSGTSNVVDDSSKSSNPVWLQDSTIALLRSTDKSTTELLVGEVTNFKKSCYLAGTINAPASNLKVAKLDEGHYGIAVTALANPDGSLHVPENPDSKKTSGKLYRSLFVRHWDQYVQAPRNAIFYTALYKIKSSSEDDVSSYKLSDLTNLLKGTSLESPMPPFGGGSDFDISQSGIVFVAKDPSLNPAINTKCDIYLAHLTSFLETTPTLYTLDMGSMQGAMTSPVFSTDGNQVAFLAMQQNGYETDKNQIFVIPDVRDPAKFRHLLRSDDGRGQWELSPGSISWGRDSSALFLTADYFGRARLFYLPLSSSSEDVKPTAMDIEGSISDVHPVSKTQIMVTATSYVDSCVFYMIKSTTEVFSANLLFSASHRGSLFGLSHSQVSEIWFKGAGKNSFTNDYVHALIVKPSTFSPREKYPVAFLVHGGPQSSWTDSWSTRWNIALWAEAGYIAVCPNPTGSTGYGQDFVDAIQGEWGGLPYQDLVRCFEYVEKNLEYADTSRTVGLGASYGGYSMNWIQGHSLGRKLKALVTHDGVFSTRFALATDELYFVNHDFGGPWSRETHEKWAKWDPSLHTDEWATPHLIIHSSRDYRLSVAEGLAAFNVLQAKGVDSQYLTFPDETHFVLRPENSLVWHQAVFAWINKHVGLPFEEVGDDVIQDPERPSHKGEEERIKVAR